jgi:CRISPR/Cas system-associated exonuclease Cas4 (RecB family)
MALKEVFKMEPTKLTYYYIEDNKPLSVDVDGEEVQKVSEWALDLIQKILEGRFLPNPGQHCGFCDYRDICEYRAK